MKCIPIIVISLSLTLANGSLVFSQNWATPKEVNEFKNPLFENTKATEKGKKIYLKLCWSCHGKTGQGDGPAATALNPSPTNYSKSTVDQTDGALFWKITNGRGSMASYKSVLTEEQRWMLVNYIRTLSREGNGSISETADE